MTKLLERALAQVYELPDTEQDAIATLILDELADEEKWQAAFARSQDVLAQLAQKARTDIKAGRAKKMGFDEL
jgi:aspartate/glutamate racemase